jgi:hypothetical protein
MTRVEKVSVVVGDRDEVQVQLLQVRGVLLQGLDLDETGLAHDASLR